MKQTEFFLQTSTGKMDTRVRYGGQNTDQILLTACCVFWPFIVSSVDVGTLHIVRFHMEAIKKTTEKAAENSLKISELSEL